MNFASLDETRLALASILGPFGVHLLKFTQDTHPGSLIHYLGLVEFPVRICLRHHNTHETYLIYPMKYDCDLITGFLFALAGVYMYVYGMRY